MTTTERMAVAERVAAAINAAEVGKGMSAGLLTARTWLGAEKGVVRVYVEQKRVGGWLEIDEDGDILDRVEGHPHPKFYAAISTVGQLYA